MLNFLCLEVGGGSYSGTVLGECSPEDETCWAPEEEEGWQLRSSSCDPGELPFPSPSEIHLFNFLFTLPPLEPGTIYGTQDILNKYFFRLMDKEMEGSHSSAEEVSKVNSKDLVGCDGTCL